MGLKEYRLGFEITRKALRMKDSVMVKILTKKSYSLLFCFNSQRNLPYYPTI